MSVELAGSVGAVSVGASVAPAISIGAGATFTQVANLDSGPIGGWGPGLAGPEPISFGRSGSSASFTEGISMFDPTYQTNFNSQSELNSADALFEAESILAQAARPQIGSLDVPNVFRTGLSDVNLDPAPFTSQAEQVAEEAWPPDTSIATLVAIYGQPEAFGLFSPQTEPKVAPVPWIEYITAPVTEVKKAVATQVVTVPRSETKVSFQTVQQSQILPQQEVSELVEEEVEVEEAQEELEIVPDAKTEQSIILHAKDQPAARNREHAIINAAVRVDAQLKESGQSGPINGNKIVELISSANATFYRGGELNQIDPKGQIPDGGWVKNLEYVNSSNFTSVEEVRERVGEIVAKAPPVIEKEGELVTDENVATSLKYIPDKIHPARLVTERVIKIGERVVRKDHQPVQTENTIQDLGLAEVFSTGLTPIPIKSGRIKSGLTDSTSLS